MQSDVRRYALLIPALNEAESIGMLLDQIPRPLFSEIIVIDNGSTDRTAEVASAAGVRVVHEPRRGYGQACLAGLAAISPDTAAIAFMDADLSDDPRDLERLTAAFEQGQCDMVIGSRVLGHRESGSLQPLQRFGNFLTTRMIYYVWQVSFTDLGPLRLVSAGALRRLSLEDRGFGWNVEMQAKAAKLRLRVTEIPVSYRRRAAGKSKISGTLSGSVRAGVKILWTIYRCWRTGSESGAAACRG